MGGSFERLPLVYGIIGMKNKCKNVYITLEKENVGSSSDFLTIVAVLSTNLPKQPQVITLTCQDTSRLTSQSSVFNKWRKNKLFTDKNEKNIIFEDLIPMQGH